MLLCHLCSLHKNLCRQLGTFQACTVPGTVYAKARAWGSWGFACESQRNPLADPCVPLNLEGLKWHVMNDFAEPEIFMHELQLYVSLLLLKATSPFDWKAAKGPSHTFCSKTAGDQHGFSSSFCYAIRILWIYSRYYNEIHNAQLLFCETVYAEKVKSTHCVCSVLPSRCPWSFFIFINSFINNLIDKMTQQT